MRRALTWHGMAWHGMAGVDGGQDLLFALRAGDEQELVLLRAVHPRHERGDVANLRVINSVVLTEGYEDTRSALFQNTVRSMSDLVCENGASSLLLWLRKQEQEGKPSCVCCVLL